MGVATRFLSMVRAPACRCALVEYLHGVESHDPAMRELVRSPTKIMDIWKDVFTRAQAGEKFSGWEKMGNGQVLPTQYMTFKPDLAQPKQRCECGKVLDYVFIVEFPMWFVEAAGLSDQTYDLGQECVMSFKVLWNGSNLYDAIQRALKPLKMVKKHGAIS